MMKLKMKSLRNTKGSVLLLSIMLLFIILTLAMAMIVQESVSRNVAVRSRMSTTQYLSIAVILQRFADTFSASKECINSPAVPAPPNPVGSANYNTNFECATSGNESFKVRGTWKSNNCIFNPPPGDPGKDFSSVPQVGYNFTTTGYNNSKVPQWQNFVAVNTPLRSRYLAVYSYWFPFGAYAPRGSITLYDAVSCANPTTTEAAQRTMDDYSGIPLNMYARDAITVGTYAYGKVYSKNGPITIPNKLAFWNSLIGFSRISPTQVSNMERFRSIIQTQLNNAFTTLSGSTLDKTDIILGKPMTNIWTYFTGAVTPDKLLTLEQSREFLFAGMTAFINGQEKELGALYQFAVHAPYPPDRNQVANYTSSVRYAEVNFYNKLDRIKQIFSRHYPNCPSCCPIFPPAPNYNIMPLPVSVPLFIAHISAEIMHYSLVELPRLYAQIGWPPNPVIIAQINYINFVVLPNLSRELADLSAFQNCLSSLLSYSKTLSYFTGLGVKDEPLTRQQDSTFNNTGWNYASVAPKIWSEIFATFNNVIYPINNIFTPTGTAILNNTVTRVRMVHFANGDFDSNFAFASSDFTFKGTLVIPKGRTMKFTGNLTIEGDLWVQDGASLYVTNDLTVRAPSSGYASLSQLVRPSGRVFIGTGSTLLVERNFSCQGTEQLGSVVVASPKGKIETITSGIMSRQGNITIPYGIMPGVSVEQLAEGNATLARQLLIFFNQAANLGKVAGAFHKRKEIFASYAASFEIIRVAPRLAPLIYVIPIRFARDNLHIQIFQTLTKIYALRLNAYLGENFIAHADWWIFGEGAVPIIPKIKTDNAFQRLQAINLSSILNTIINLEQNSIAILSTAPNLFTQMIVAMGQVPIIYNRIVIAGFRAPVNSVIRGGNGKDDSTLSSENLSPFFASFTAASNSYTSVVNQSESNQNNFNNTRQSLNNTFFGGVYSDIASNLPGGASPASFTEAPGILVYSGRDLIIGSGSIALTPNKILPACGLLIAKRNLIITGPFRILGCLISLDGYIQGANARLRFYPYFTRASLYVPKTIDNNDQQVLLTSSGGDLESVNHLKSNKIPQEIGVTIPRILTEGWDNYSEFYEYKLFE